MSVCEFETDSNGNILGVKIRFERPIAQDDLPTDMAERRDYVCNRAKIALDELAGGELQTE